MREPRRSAVVIAAITMLVALATLMAASAYAAVTGTAAPQCAANVRSGPSTAYRIRTVISTKDTVTVADQVHGSIWSTPCGGKTVTGTTWDRISAINGVTVKSRFGTAYLYVAAGVMAWLPGSPIVTQPSQPPPTPTVRPTVEPTPSAPPSAPPASPTVTPSPAVVSSPSTAATTTPGPPTPAATATTSAAGPVTPGGGGSRDIVNLPFAISLIGLAVISTILSAVVVAQRRRRAAGRRSETVPASRLEDVLH